MIEQIFQMSATNERIIERVLWDENLHYNHIVLKNGEGVPEHFSNSNVYLTVLRGTLSIGLNDQPTHEYAAGRVLKIPSETKMNIKNLHDDVLEFILIKAPAPKN